MADLSVNFGGLKLSNPIILASATPGWDGEHLARAGENGAGAVIPKTIGPPQEWAQHPRCGRLRLIRAGGRPFGMVNLELFTTKSKEEWINGGLLRARRGGAKVIASILAMPDPDETGVLAREVEATGAADMLELNVSCPMPAATVGMHIGKNPSLTARQVRAVKAASSLPLTIKLTPNVSDLIDVAGAAVGAGANAISISNSIRSFAGVDVETGRPYLPAFGGYTGPAIKPVIQRLIIEVLKSGIKVPVSAVGGVTTWQDAVEYLMIGATAVQVATVVMWEGYGRLGKIVRGIEEFMERKGYRSIEDFRGMTLPHVTTVEQYAKLPPKFAEVDAALCNGCGICERVCSYDAIVCPDKKAVAVPFQDKCDGCGLCAEWCPKGAIILKEMKVSACAD